MNNDLVMVGNSHSACRYLAAETLHRGGIANDRISWICQGGNAAPFEVDAAKRLLRPAFSSARSAIIEVYIRNGVRIANEAISEDAGISLESPFDLVLSSVGVRPPAVLMRSHLCHYMSRHPVSDALIAAWVRGQNLARVLPKLAALRKAGFTGRIFVTPWVRPYSLPDFCTTKAWRRFCAAEQRALAQALEPVDAVLLPFPEGCEVRTPVGLTNAKPRVHGNEHYGDLINRVFLQAAYPQLAAQGVPGNPVAVA